MAWRLKPSQMSFGVSDGRDFEYNGASPNGLFASRGHMITPSFHRMIADLVRFNRDARELLASEEDPSLREWLAERRYSRAFVERLIVPQASAVWSADPAQMWSFPARFLVEFFDNHGMLGFRDRPRWRTISRRIAQLRRGAHAALARAPQALDTGDGGRSSSQPCHGVRARL